MDREGFRNRLKQYKLAREENPGLKYWEWKLKYDSAPKPDNMPSQPKPDTPMAGSQLAENRAHRWDNEHYVDQVNTVFDADRHRSWKEPALKTFGNRVKFTYRDFMKPADVKHMNFLKSIGRLGSALKGASIFGEVVQNLFPSEEAELIEDMRAKMDKQNGLLTGLEPRPIYNEGTDGVMGPPTYEQWDTDTNRYTPTILDNASLYWSMEAAKKDLHNAAMKLPGYAERWAEYYRSLPKTDPDINEFVDELWENENPNNVGLKNGKYYPHKSPEGGAATIGPGFKLGSGSHKITKKQAERGMTKSRLDQEARRIGKQHLNAVDQFINYGQTTNPADTVSPQIKMGLMDLRHLVGPLNEWSSLREAVLNGDIEGIRKESTVTWNDDGKTKVDKRRKKIRDKKYFHYDEGGEVTQDGIVKDTLENIDWLTDWYNARLQYAKNTSNHDVINQISSLHSHFYPEVSTRKFSVPWNSEIEIMRNLRQPLIQGVGVTINDKAIRNYENLNGVKIGGYYHPNDGVVLPSNYNKIDLLHELSHSFNSYDLPLWDAINNAISDEQGNVSVPANIINPEYWISPDEVHSRLMQFRKENNINPLKKHSIDDVKQLRKTSKDKQLFMFFDDSQMQNLLNNVANQDNTTNQNENGFMLFKAAEGGEVTDPIKNPVLPQSYDPYFTEWLANWLNNRRKQLKLHQLDMFTDDQLLKMFNEVAENTVEENRTHKSKRA